VVAAQAVGYYFEHETGGRNSERLHSKLKERQIRDFTDAGK
jgi:hypothetical protein